MAPTPSAPQQPAASSDAETTALPPLVRSSTVPTSLQSHRADPSHLAPEDAFHSPPRRPPVYENASGNELRPGRLRRKNGSRSRSRRRKRFQKLLWVKQSCEFSAGKPERLGSSEHLCLTPPVRRSRQLHRPGDIPREPPAQPAPPTLRLLALDSRLHYHSPARLLRHNLRRLLRRHLPGARQPRVRRRLGQRRYLPRLVTLGLVGRPSR